MLPRAVPDDEAASPAAEVARLARDGLLSSAATVTADLPATSTTSAPKRGRGRPRRIAGEGPVTKLEPVAPVPAELRLTDVRGVAALLCLSIPATWKAVRDKRVPAPFYPAARAPRWRVSEVVAAIEATRALPAEQVAARRAAKLAAQPAADRRDAA